MNNRYIMKNNLVNIITALSLASSGWGQAQEDAQTSYSIRQQITSQENKTVVEYYNGEEKLGSITYTENPKQAVKVEKGVFKNNDFLANVLRHHPDVNLYDGRALQTKEEWVRFERHYKNRILWFIKYNAFDMEVYVNYEGTHLATILELPGEEGYKYTKIITLGQKINSTFMAKRNTETNDLVGFYIDVGNDDKYDYLAEVKDEEIDLRITDTFQENFGIQFTLLNIKKYQRFVGEPDLGDIRELIVDPGTGRGLSQIEFLLCTDRQPEYEIGYKFTVEFPSGITSLAIPEVPVIKEPKKEEEEKEKVRL